jgi:hypothetical protein
MWGGRMKKVIKPLCETTNENPRCDLHIPQHKKGIYMLNIIVQNLLEKKTKEIDPKNIQNPNALTTVHKLDGGKNLENNTKENQVAHFWG